MSDLRLSSTERGHLAAEYALGVLEGDALALAERLAAMDSEFRAQVGLWSSRLSPMLDEVDPVEPPTALRERLEAATSAPEPLAGKLRLWRGVAGGMTALAAALALILVVQPHRTIMPPPPAHHAPMMAMLGDTKAPPMMLAAWDSDRHRLTVISASASPAGPGRSHELWVIPADGTPRSLGVMPTGKTMRMQVPGAMADRLSEGVTLAVSVEPAGGSPTGAPTGPVIASGKLEQS